MAKPVLGYWSIRAMAQPSRFLLNYLGVDYEEKLYDSTIPNFMEPWLAEKFTLGLDFPDLPYWIDGDVKLTESRVILKQIAKKYGAELLPATEELQVKSDMVENYVSDVGWILGMFCYFQGDADEAVTAMFEKAVSGKLQILSTFIGSRTWSLGEQLTYIDFLVYEVLFVLKSFKPELVNLHSNLSEFVCRFEALPSIATYMKSPRYIARPVYMPVAKINPL